MGRWTAGCARAIGLLSLFAAALVGAPEPGEQQAMHLQERAYRLYESGRYREGIDIANRAVALETAAAGPEHPAVAASLQILGQLYLSAGNYDLAQAALRRALAVREKVLGPEHPDTAATLIGLADSYSKSEEHAKAEPLYRRALAILETRGVAAIEISAALSGLATVHMELADYARAEPLLERALAISERAAGAEGASTATVLNAMGNLRFYMGQLAHAKILYERALTIREKLNGPEHPEIARVLANLGAIYSEAGDYVPAETVLKRALASQEKWLGREHPGTNRTALNLAILYKDTGAYAQAIALFRQIIGTQRRTPRGARGDLLLSLAGLGIIYSDLGRHTEAETLCKEAVAIAASNLPAGHPYTRNAVGNLGSVYRRMGAYEKAAALLKRSIALSESALDPAGLETARAIYSLADLYRDTGAYAEAEPLYRRVIAIYGRTLGSEHPKTARALRSLAVLHWAQGKSQQALSLLQRAQRIQGTHADRFLTAGSEERKQDYVRTSTEDTFNDVSFAMSTPSNAGAAMAMASVLRHKGRVLDALSDNMARLRRSLAPNDRALLEQLAGIVGQLSALAYGSGGNYSSEQYRARASGLAARRSRLETQLASRSGAFAREMMPVTVANIQRVIPANAVLLEWIRYRPCAPGCRSFAPPRAPPRYVVFVLKRKGTPVAIDIGDAQEVEALVLRLRAALANADSADVKQHAASLSAKLVAPLHGYLRGVEHILFAPDGELNLVPMAALVDETGEYLAERFDVSYLTSGRDLLRLSAGSRSPVETLVIADPDYGRPGTLRNSPFTAQRSPDLDRSGFVFRPLASTALEARDIQDLLDLDPANVLLGPEATEATLKRVKSPRILHIASHGFFLSDQQLSDVHGSGGPTPALALNENPLLRSGLALAGANERSSGKDDGILTALEVTQLDLSGTELVVLSACDSGIGQIKNGEGVYGLRRALILAGAQTQVTSLWKVSDAATRNLMVDYYQRLSQGEGRSAALRSAQRTMLASSTFSHPYYWASFILIGNWNSLSGLREKPRSLN